MLALPADTLTRRGSQSGQITCYEMRTDHLLSTPDGPPTCPSSHVRLACPRPILKRSRVMSKDPKPAKSKEAKLPVARKSLKSASVRVRDLEKRLAEAHEQ